jgi:hypothetical protein
MVEIKTSGGRLGNQMFEYAFGRIIAEELGYKLIHNLNLLQPFNLPSINGKSFNTTEQYIDGLNFYSDNLLNEIIGNKNDRKITLHGYFQKYCYIKPYKEKIKNWFHLDKEDVYFDDTTVGIHLRKGDLTYCNQWMDMDDSYYLNILERENFDKIIITSDTPDYPLIKNIISKYKNVALFNADTLSTLKVFSCFKNLILSNGTFSWWMAFLGNPKKVYMKNFIHDSINLVVNDDPRYIIIP